MHRFLNNETNTSSVIEQKKYRPLVKEISSDVVKRHQFPEHYTSFIPKDLNEQKAGGSNSYDLEEKLEKVALKLQNKERLIYQKIIDGKVVEKEIVSKDEIKNVAKFVSTVANIAYHVD